MINFLPWREILRQKRKKRLWIECVGVLICVFFSSIFLQIYNHHVLVDQKNKLNILERKLMDISVNYRDALNKQKQDDIDRKQEVLLKSYKNTNQKLFDTLDVLVNEMPNEIYLTGIRKEGVKLYLLGKSHSHVELATFLQRIAVKTHGQPIVTETTHTADQPMLIDFEIGYEEIS